MRMTKVISGTGTLAAAVATALAGTAHAQAQQPAAFELQEIVVSARKRDENLNDVPVAIRRPPMT